MSLTSPSPPLRDLSFNQVQWIAGGFVMCMASLPGQTIFVAQFNTAIRESFSLSHGEFGLLYTAATLASSICIIWAGALADRIAPKKLAIITLLGTAAVSIGMSFVQNIVLLTLMLFGLRFLGQGMIMHISATAMARWFNRYRGRAIAIAQMGVPVGQGVLPFLTLLAIATFGWRQVWLLAAGVVIVVLIPCIAFLLRDPPDGARALARGSTNPDGMVESASRRRNWTRREAIKDPFFYLVLPVLIAPPGIITIMLFHQAHLVRVKGWDLTVFTGLFPIMALSVVCLSFISGILVDKYGAWRILPLILVPLLCACLLVAFVSIGWAVPIFMLGVGMTFGIFSPVGGAIWPELYGTAHIGAIRALATSGLVLASAVGPGVAGMLIDIGVDLPAQSMVYAAYCAAMIVIFLFMRNQLKTRIQDGDQK